LPDYYSLLSVSPSASSAEIKQAYRRILLLYHPDKHTLPDGVAQAQPISTAIDVGLLKEAYTTLTSSALRAAYDSRRIREPRSGDPRPAQIISLEDFDEIGQDAEVAKWAHSCRCGGSYVITETAMEAGEHLVGCDSCSEVVWVGFELAEEEAYAG